MNTKLLMTTSAALLGTAGIIFIFLPQEVCHYAGLPESNLLIVQMPGALYFGFAMLNWTARANLIGGIYSRPVAIANFTHFFIGGLALVKILFTHTGSILIWAVTAAYLLFASLFAYITFAFSGLKKQSQ